MLLTGWAGSGKGTQARLLQSRLGMRHIDFGQARRTAVKVQSAAGRRIAAMGDLVSGGKFISDELVTEVFLEALQREERQATGSAPFVLDGCPRTVSQLEMLREAGVRLDLAVWLEAPFDALLRRTDGRLIHVPSGRTYHPTECPPRVPMRDDVTGEPLEERRLSSRLSAEAYPPGR